jgi:hypothetical protein
MGTICMIKAVVITCIFGWLSQYDLGVMEQVIINRQLGRTAVDLPQVIPPVDGYIAVLSCDDIGELRTLKYAGHEYVMLVADCAGDRRARRWMTVGGVIAEVDGKFAKEHGFIGRGVKAELCKTGAI